IAMTRKLGNRRLVIWVVCIGNLRVFRIGLDDGVLDEHFDLSAWTERQPYIVFYDRVDGVHLPNDVEHRVIVIRPECVADRRYQFVAAIGCLVDERRHGLAGVQQDIRASSRRAETDYSSRYAFEW